jgi:glycosyltransferase involved in cell wall biosynthesis
MASVDPMRLLFLTNFYPPAHLGGKEIRCQEVVQGLQSRGHACLVLTSSFVPPGVTLPDQPGVRRELALEADVYHYRPLNYLLQYSERLRANLNAFKATASSFEPDIVFIWGMWNLSPALAAAAEAQLHGRVVYSLGGYWPIEPDMHEQYWCAQDGKWPGRLFRKVLALFALSRKHRPVQARELRFAHVITCSRFVLEQLQEGGLALPHAKVVFSGIDVNEFVPAPGTASRLSDQLKVVYAGGIAARKGVHVAVEAMRLLVEQGHQNISLSIIGAGHPSYRARLKKMVDEAAFSERVRFQPAVPRRSIPHLLQQFDVLVLPSVLDVPEPLSRVVMEAMACGLVVVATDTGGTPEMIEHDVNGLLFASGDSAGLANHLQALAASPELRRRLSAAARQTAETRFQIGRMIDEMEMFLAGVLAKSTLLS